MNNLLFYYQKKMHHIRETINISHNQLTKGHHSIIIFNINHHNKF